MAQVIISMGDLALFLLAIAVGVGLYNLVEYLIGGREE
jgi:hypothetical protein